MDPSTLRYTKTHEWTGLADGVCTIGISKFAADQLQDITYIKLPKVGAKLQVDKGFGEIETVKAVSELYAPVNGDVVAFNQAVVDNLDLVKEDPFGAGWLVKVKLADGATLNHLMDAAAYQKQCESEPH